MTQTLALILDAYRDLNARKLFWITLILSALVVAALAAVGVEPDALTFFGKRVEVFDPAMLYRSLILSDIVIGVWLSWGAVILAIISTGGIYPDLMTGGAIDLYLSKPMSRLRLFITKYFTGLLFVSLQLAIFCVGCFLIVGWRSHEWRPALFLAIPLVTLLFSYIYGFCVLLAVWTRSTITALILTILIWLGCSGIARADTFMSFMHRALEMSIARLEKDIVYIDAQKPSAKLFDFQPGLLRKRRETDVEQLADLRGSLKWISVVHLLTSAMHKTAPKTTETNNLLDRYLLSDEEIIERSEGRGGPSLMGVNPFDLHQAATETELEDRRRSPAYVIGTSLLCELIVAGLAAWIFCRRDY